MVEAATEESGAWLSAPRAPNLDGEVHVWLADLNIHHSQLARWQETLSSDELGRATRFHFARDRHRFIIARGVLRAIIARYGNKAPRKLQFSYSGAGKPNLIGESGAHALHFNVSHSHNLALFAFARGREIGVDLEYIHPDYAWRETAQRFFSRAENAALHALPIEKQRAAFFRFWTHKEACLKARGDGLNACLNECDVCESVVALQNNDGNESHWWLHELIVAPNYAAALAVQGRDSPLQLRQFQFD